MERTNRKKSISEYSRDEVGVLVVDDDRDYLMMVPHYFENSGFKIFCASSGEEALSLLRTRRFFLMLTDFNMPGMDGLKLSREAKKIAPGMVIVMATGDCVEYLEPLALEAGVDAVLPKPLNFEKLFSKASIENLRKNQYNVTLGKIMEVKEIYRDAGTQTRHPLARRNKSGLLQIYFI